MTTNEIKTRLSSFRVVDSRLTLLGSQHNVSIVLKKPYQRLTLLMSGLEVLRLAKCKAFKAIDESEHFE